MDNVSKAQPEQHAYHPLSAQDTEQHLQELFSGEETGYHKGLKNRQIQMIALGGAIGTGLFMGAGGRLATAGPSLMFVYLACGVISYLVLRALGELVLHRPSSGSFVSYAREFYGEKAAFVCGWVYWFGWAMAGIVDTTAVALYMHFFSKYWAPIASVPQWVFALIALVLILSMNLVSVKVFGELEFWFALIKVVALVAFLVIGAAFVIFGTPTAGHEVGFQLIANNGGFLPHGLLPAILIVSGVVFAFAGVELLGNAAGETENPEKVIPKAINTVIFRIAVFYVGSVLLLCLLLPYTAYQAGVSPFVTFFGSIGWDGIDAIMNMVVLTAALSSLNAGLYSTGRILHSMSYAGSAPKFASRMNAAGVPYTGILLTGTVTLLGVGLNAVVPDKAFEIVLNGAAFGTLVCWGMLALCQLKLARWSKQGIAQRPATFRMPGSPYTSYLVLVFLVGVFVLIAFDYPVGTWTVASLAVFIPLLVAGWFACRNRILAIAEERLGFTGELPVLAKRPLAASKESGPTEKKTDPESTD